MSTYTDTLNKLLVSPVPEVVNLAEKATRYLAERDEGKITQSEFEELMTDLASLDHINERMIKLEVWREITTAAEIVMKIKAGLSLI